VAGYPGDAGWIDASHFMYSNEAIYDIMLKSGTTLPFGGVARIPGCL
jgi:hypothetical protein